MYIHLLLFQDKDTVLSSMTEAQISNISEATQLSTIVVLATDKRTSMPVDTLVRSRKIKMFLLS